MAKSAVANAAKDQTMRSVATDVAKSIAVNGGTEAVTELAQESALMVSAAAAGGKYTRQEVISRLIESAVVGGAMGGTTGAGVHGLEVISKSALKQPVPDGQNIDPVDEQRDSDVSPDEARQTEGESAGKEENYDVNTGSVRRETRFEVQGDSIGEAVATRVSKQRRAKAGANKSAKPKVVVIGGGDNPKVDMIGGSRQSNGVIRNQGATVNLNSRDQMDNEPLKGATVKVIDPGGRGTDENGFTVDNPTIVSVKLPDQDPIEVSLNQGNLSLDNYTIIVDNSGEQPTARLVQNDADKPVMRVQQGGINREISITNGQPIITNSSNSEDIVESSYSVPEGNIPGSAQRVKKVKSRVRAYGVMSPEVKAEVQSADGSLTDQYAKANQGDSQVSTEDHFKDRDERIKNQPEEQNRWQRSKVWFMSWFQSYRGVNDKANSVIVRSTVGEQKAVASSATAIQTTLDEHFTTKEDLDELSAYLNGTKDIIFTGDKLEAASAARALMDKNSEKIAASLWRDAVRQATHSGVEIPAEIQRYNPSLDPEEREALISGVQDNVTKSRLRYAGKIVDGFGSYMKRSYKAFDDKEAWVKRFGSGYDNMTSQDKTIWNSMIDSIVGNIEGRINEQEEKQLRFYERSKKLASEADALVASGRNKNDHGQSVDELRSKSDEWRERASKMDPRSNNVVITDFIKEIVGKESLKKALNDPNPATRSDSLRNFAERGLSEFAKEIIESNDIVESIINADPDKPSAMRAMLQDRDELPESFRAFLVEETNPKAGFLFTIDNQIRALSSVVFANNLIESLEPSGLLVHQSASEIPPGYQKIKIEIPGTISSSIGNYYADERLRLVLTDYFSIENNSALWNISMGVNGAWKLNQTVYDVVDMPRNAWGSVEAMISTGVLNISTLKESMGQALSDLSSKGGSNEASSIYEGLTKSQAKEALIRDGISGDSLNVHLVSQAAGEVVQLVEAATGTKGRLDQRSRDMRKLAADYEASFSDKAADGLIKTSNAVRTAYGVLDDAAKLSVHASFYKREREIYKSSHEDAWEAATDFTRKVMPSGNQSMPLVQHSILARNPISGQFLTFFSEGFRTASNRIILAHKWIKTGSRSRQLDALKMMSFSAITPSILVPIAASTTAGIMLGEDEINEQLPDNGTSPEVARALNALRPDFGKFANTIMVGRDGETGEYLMVDSSLLSTFGPVSDSITSVYYMMANKNDTDIWDVLNSTLGPIYGESFVTRAVLEMKDGKIQSPEDLLDFVSNSFSNGTIKVANDVANYIAAQPNEKGQKKTGGEIASQFAGVPIIRRNTTQMVKNKMYPIRKEVKDAKRDLSDKLFQPRPISEEDAYRMIQEADEKNTQAWNKAGFALYNAKVLVEDINAFTGREETVALTMKKMLVKEASGTKGVLSNSEFDALIRGRIPPLSVETNPKKNRHLGLKVGKSSSLDEKAKAIINENIRVYEAARKRFEAER